MSSRSILSQHEIFDCKGQDNKEEEKDFAKQIADSGANILFVAISSPTKENFLYENKHLLNKWFK